MRRSICYCEPAICMAGEMNTWKFIYTPSNDLPKGTRLKFDLLSRGRDIDWEIPQASSKKQENLIYALLENGKTISPKEVHSKESVTPSFEFTLPSPVDAGSSITILLGSPKLEKGAVREQGNRAQKNTQRRRAFHLYVDPTGKGKYDDPEVFNIDIKGNELKTIKILTPSFVTRNKRFDIILRFEDEFGNLTSEAPEDTLIELTYENIRENLNWKLFVPETGFISLPNLYFNEPGIYTIRLINHKTKEIFRSSPIKCFNENNKSLFWGLFHGESERYDSTESIESCLRHFRDEKAMNFYGVSPFENPDETSADMWKVISQNVIEFNEDDRFVTFQGAQWQGAPKKEGVRHIVYLKEAKNLIKKKDNKINSIEKLYKSFSPKEIIAVPSFTMAKGLEYDFKTFDSEFERVVEIYNSWGSSECSGKEGNPFPIESTDKSGVQESTEGSVVKALMKNCRFGFIAGGLDDRGFYAGFYEGGQAQYPPGMTAIMAPEHNRQAIGEALYNRSCYATTGERIILGLYLAGYNMGKEISTVEKPGLMINRHLTGYVAGTADLAKVEIIRNGKIIKTFEPDGYAFEFAYDDMEGLDKVVIDAKDKKPPFVFYYLRIQQVDGHMAWSSPIWVDYVPVKMASKQLPKKSAKQVIKEASLDIDFDDEDEEDFEDFDED